MCDDSWDIREAAVVCRQLRYGYAILAIQAAAFGQGSGGQWDRNWFCTGNEGSLDGCSSSSTTCFHSEDASVICSSSGKCVPCPLPHIISLLHYSKYPFYNLPVFRCQQWRSEVGEHREHSVWRSSGALL